MAHHKLIVPREHGAWVQLALPLVAALTLSAPGTAASWLLASAALLAFTAHEALLVVLGLRGRRSQQERGPQAQRLLYFFGSAATLAGITGMVLGGVWVWIACTATVAPALLLAPLLRRRREKTTTGELLAALALAGLGLPVGLAAGLSPHEAVIIWLFWVAAFTVETLTVRGVLAMAKKRAATRRLLVIAALLALAIEALAVVLAALGVIGAAVPWAFAPVLLLALITLARPPSARRLFVVGLALAGLGVLSLTALLIGPILGVS